jgi:disulfide bond formation protein DsbB
MDYVDEANTLFTVLTLLADVALVALVLVGIGALVGGGPRRVARRVVAAIGPRAPALAFVVATVTTAGSLYYSEIVGYLPCELCWFQRICMYPLVAVLGVGLLRKDRSAIWYAAPLVVAGAPVSLYHWLVERVPSLAESSSCSVFAPCTVPFFQELGYVTLAFMALSSFLLIGALLVTTWASDRLAAGEGASGATGSDDATIREATT